MGTTLVVFAVCAGTAFAAPVKLESFTLKASDGTTRASKTVLSPTRIYQLSTAGRVNLWTADPSGVYNDFAWGVDPLYCYAPWRCPTVELWRQLSVDGVGLDQWGQKAGRIPYAATHAYSVARPGTGKRLSLGIADAMGGSAGDNSGSFVVDLWDLGPVSSKITYSFTGYANNVRDRPEYQLGVTNMRGSGVLRGSVNGWHTTQQVPTSDPASSISTDVLAYSYAASAHGVRKVLTLTVRVYASTSTKNCKQGVTGTIVLVDDSRKLSNGQNRDSITTSFPAKPCPTFVQGTSNADNPQTDPVAGGPGGGQWAKVSIVSQG